MKIHIPGSASEIRTLYIQIRNDFIIICHIIISNIELCIFYACFVGNNVTYL